MMGDSSLQSSLVNHYLEMISISTLLIFTAISHSHAKNFVLRERNFKPVERFNDLALFDQEAELPSNKSSFCEPKEENTQDDQKPDMKYILQWTPANHEPFLSMGVGQDPFITRNCLHINCFVTSKITLFDDVTKFDAILFNGLDVKDLPKFMLPQQRCPSQKYVFVSTLPSDDIPVFLKHFDGFFNWTWTYKLNSDLVWGSIVITNHNNTIIGPAPDMNWIKNDKMGNISSDLVTILKGKSKAVAWFPTKCYSSSNRESIVNLLKTELESKYNLSIDIYGHCGEFKCSWEENEDEDCYEVIRREYFFYLAYEDALSEDYVTDLLPAVKYNAVPIVYGGADYRRFLPDGSYLNAREMSVESLADKIYELINNYDEYSEYFKWTNHYKYYGTSEHEDTDEMCRMCKLLNRKRKFCKKTVYYKFREWWSPVQYRARFATTTTTTTKSPRTTIVFRYHHIRTRTPEPEIPVTTTEKPPQDLWRKILNFGDLIHNALIGKGKR